MSSSNINTALVVGLGSIGRRHLRLLREIRPNIKIIAVRHSHESTQNYEADLSVYSIDEALKQDPDMAIVANPSPFHLETSRQLMSSGVHLLIEKPLSINTKGVEEFLKNCSKTKCKVMTGFNLRFLPCLEELKSEIKSGTIGKVLSVRVEVGQNLKTWRPEQDYSSSVSSKKRLGGGVILELCHEIDYILWIFGSVKWTIAHLSRQSSLDVDVEDTADILMGLKLKAFNQSEVNVSLNMDFTRHDNHRLFTVIGEKGTLKSNLIKGRLSHFSEKTDQWKDLSFNQVDRDYSYREQLKHFLCCIEENNTLRTTGEDGLEVLKVIDKIKESHSEESKLFI